MGNSQNLNCKLYDYDKKEITLIENLIRNCLSHKVSNVDLEGKSTYREEKIEPTQFNKELTIHFSLEIISSVVAKIFSLNQSISLINSALIPKITCNSNFKEEILHFNNKNQIENLIETGDCKNEFIKNNLIFFKNENIEEFMLKTEELDSISSSKSFEDSFLSIISKKVDKPQIISPENKPERRTKSLFLQTMNKSKFASPIYNNIGKKHISEKVIFSFDNNHEKKTENIKKVIFRDNFSHKKIENDLTKKIKVKNLQKIIKSPNTINSTKGKNKISKGKAILNLSKTSTFKKAEESYPSNAQNKIKNKKLLKNKEFRDESKKTGENNLKTYVIDLRSLENGSEIEINNIPDHIKHRNSFEIKKNSIYKPFKRKSLDENKTNSSSMYHNLKNTMNHKNHNQFYKKVNSDMPKELVDKNGFNKKSNQFLFPSYDINFNALKLNMNCGEKMKILKNNNKFLFENTSQELELFKALSRISLKITEND